MSSIEITFANPWLLLLAIPSFAIILFPFFRLPKKRRSTAKKIVPVVLHLIVVAILVLILSGFNLIRVTDEQAVIVLMDLSDSTKKVQDDMTAHVQELLDLMEKEVPIGVVAFAENQIYSVKMDDKTKELEAVKVAAEVTDIDAAMEYAAKLLPADKVGRLILFTDGKQNDSDADNTAHYLATQGIRIDAVYYDTTTLGGPEIQISSLSAPTGAYVGDEIVFTAEIKSNYDGIANVVLYDGETAVQTMDATITTGSNLLEIATKAETSGTHAYRLSLEVEEDSVAQNNECFAYLNVAGNPSILIIANSYSETFELEELLEGENTITSVMASSAPKTIVELCNYDEVILSNVNYEELPEGYDKLLETYVSKYGRSLLTAGGESTYMYGHMEGTALEEMLPVTLSLSEDTEARSVALMLVLDCSSSMVSQRTTQGTYLSVAKQGAIKCVETMTKNDYVGVISFSRLAMLNSPLVQATEENKTSLNQIISRLAAGRGTYYTDALLKAQEELNKSSAEIKHVLFLSDGNPSDREFYNVVSGMASDGITVSTIGLGYSSGILSSLAETGGGRYYYVEDANSLPDIMLSETEQVVVSSLKRGEFTPVIAEESELTSELRSKTLPTLTGYLGTTAKEEATVYLTIDDENPLYAQWQYGAGTVGCFTSDLKANWTGQWFANAVGQNIMKNMVKTTIPDVHDESSIHADISVKGKTVTVVATTAATGEDHTLHLSFVSDQNQNVYDFVKTSSRVYETTVSVEDVGVYDILITELDTKGEIVDTLETAIAVSYSKEYDAFAESGEGLLINMCNYSNGTIYKNMQEAANASVAEMTTVINPMIPFGVIAAILMLADIAIRKLRWKDIRNYWMKLKGNLVR